MRAFASRVERSVDMVGGRGEKGSVAGVLDGGRGVTMPGGGGFAGVRGCVRRSR